LLYSLIIDGGEVTLQTRELEIGMMQDMKLYEEQLLLYSTSSCHSGTVLRVSARRRGKFWGRAEKGCGSDSEQSNRQFSYVRGLGGFVFVLGPGWLAGLGFGPFGLGAWTRDAEEGTNGVELAEVFLCACMHVIVAIPAKRQTQ
jgi:hypothetical protein